MLIDTHAHIDDRKFAQDLDQVVSNAKSVGVGYLINIGCDLTTSRRSVELANKYDNIFATVGIHPHYAANVSSGYLEVLEKYFVDRKVLAIGEIGLDFFRDLSPRDVQAKVFKEQLDLAQRLGKTVVIHDRDAHNEVLDILKSYSDLTIVMHCYAAGPYMMQEFLKIGCYISIGGPVTYDNAPKLVEVAQKVPQDRLLVETDCPYLTPKPHRGERNEPAYVDYVARKVAEIRKMPYAELCDATTQNAIKAFGIAFDN